MNILPVGEKPMRAVVQRVKKSSVSVNEQTVAAIDDGLLVLLGVGREDNRENAEWMAAKIVHLRIFEDENGRFNRSLLDTGGQMLVVSQFTLYGDCRKGRRPSFIQAAAPEAATDLYLYFVQRVGSLGIAVQTGQFRTMMDVSLVNHGPVTLILER
jgi:D-tyrosyl-tRNA(Tyr) deacylase